MTPEEKFRFINEEVAREQEYFWARFSSFATLHAGLFVLVTLDKLTHPSLLTGIAIVLGLIWWYVQKASLWYVNRLKPDLHKAAKKVGFKWPRHCLYSCEGMSTTDIAIIVPMLLTILWFVLFITSTKILIITTP